MAEKIDKPWGYELIWAKAEGYVGKILHVRAGESLSLQYHRVKDETMYVHAGKIDLELEGDDGQMSTLTLQAGDSQRILPGRRHRVTAQEDSDLLEASTNHLDDVVRLEDRYGRADPGGDGDG